MFALEGILQGQLVQMPCTEQGQLWLIRSSEPHPCLTWRVCRDRAPTTSLGNSVSQNQNSHWKYMRKFTIVFVVFVSLITTRVKDTYFSVNLIIFQYFPSL